MTSKDHLMEAAEALALRPDAFGDMHVLTLREGLASVDQIFQTHHEDVGRAKESERIASAVAGFRESAKAAREESIALDSGDGSESAICEARAAAYEAVVAALAAQDPPADEPSALPPRWALFSRACSVRGHTRCNGKAAPPFEDLVCVCSCHGADDGEGE